VSDPRRAWFGDVYERGSADSPHYALTFDDGPLPGATDVLLDTLKALNAPATFFVVGRFAKRWPDLIRRIHDEGHLIGNHTYDHSRLAMLRGPWYWRRQIADTDAAIFDIIGKRPLMFRPPFGIRTPINMPQIHRAGQACVMWTLRAKDGVAATSDQILNRLLPGAAAGDIMLLHDGREPASRRDPTPTLQAIEPLVHTLHERGLTPARVDELLGIPAYAAD